MSETAAPTRLARLLRGWRGAVLLYLAFTGRLPRGGERPAAFPLPLQPLRLSRRGLAARTARPRRTATQRKRLGQGRGAQAARRTGGPGHLRQPHRRSHRPLLSVARHARDGSRRRHRLPDLDPVRLVSTVPGGADVAVRRRLGAPLQRRPVHRVVGGPQPDAVVPAVAVPAHRRPVPSQRRGRPLADRAVRRRVGLLLLLGRRPGLVHRARRGRDAVDRLRLGLNRRPAPGAGRALRGARFRHPPALGRDSPVLVRSGARGRRPGRAADTGRQADSSRE